MTDAQKDEIVRLYVEEKVSRNELAVRFNASRPFVTDLLKSRGVAVRGGNEASRLHNALPVNEVAFASVAGPEAAYWVGFLMADGCISVQRGRTHYVILSLSLDDYHHVRKFRMFVDSEHPIALVAEQSRTVSNGQVINGGPMVRLAFASNQMAADLAKVGVVPSKTARAAACPALAADRHFWRGVIDGDGAVYTYLKRKKTETPRLNIVGTKALVGQYAAFVRRLTDTKTNLTPDKSCWQFPLEGRHAARIIKVLYENAPVALDRKAEAAAHILSKFKCLLDDATPP